MTTELPHQPGAACLHISLTWEKNKFLCCLNHCYLGFLLYAAMVNSFLRWPSMLFASYYLFPCVILSLECDQITKEGDFCHAGSLLPLGSHTLRKQAATLERPHGKELRMASGQEPVRSQGLSPTAHRNWIPTATRAS